MTDILDLIDNATEQRCACGCRTPLDPDGPSAWFASQECQRRWGDAQATDPQDVYSRPDAGHEPPRGAYVQPAWSAAIDRARSELAAAYGIPEAVIGPGCYESGPGPTADTITFEVDDLGGRFGYDEDRVTVCVRQQARVREDGTLELGPLMMSTAPEWLAHAFPEVDRWEQRRDGLWRGQSAGMFARDTWLYVLRDGDDYVSHAVTGEMLASCRVDAERLVEEKLREGIERGRASHG